MENVSYGERFLWRASRMTIYSGCTCRLKPAFIEKREAGSGTFLRFFLPYFPQELTFARLARLSQPLDHSLGVLLSFSW